MSGRALGRSVYAVRGVGTQKGPATRVRGVCPSDARPSGEMPVVVMLIIMVTSSLNVADIDATRARALASSTFTESGSRVARSRGRAAPSGIVWACT